MVWGLGFGFQGLGFIPREGVRPKMVEVFGRTEVAGRVNFEEDVHFEDPFGRVDVLGRMPPAERKGNALNDFTDFRT